MIGQMELEPVGSVMGYNYVLSEFHAAILLDRLQYLDQENKIRDNNVQYLNSMLQEIGGITPLCSGANQGRLTYHKYTVRLSLEEFGGNKVETIAKAISAELNFPAIGTLDQPMNRNPLFNPYSSPRFWLKRSMLQEYNPRHFDLPVATKASQECLFIRHYAFLGTRRDMEDIAEAFAKVKRWSHLLLG